MILLAMLNVTASAHKVHVVNIDCKDDTLINRHEIHGCRRHHKHCTCQSLDNAFVNPTNNTVYNITADTTLSSLLKGTDLGNITITGHNSPTIKCGAKGGGLRLLSCHNCTIENIVWDGCGVQVINQYTLPVILLGSSSNVKIKNCTFQYSIGQAIGLADMAGPGDIIISHSKFLNNIVPDNGGSSGAVIYYYPSGRSSYPDTNNVVLISNCLFTSNSVSGVIFFFPSPLVLLLKDCTFRKNQGTSVFIYSDNKKGFDIGGKVIFEDNVAKEGGGIYIYDYSSVRFLENSMVIFNNNSAYDSGGAINMKSNASLLFDQGSTVIFCNNKATNGGAIAAINNGWIFSEKKICYKIY